MKTRFLMRGALALAMVALWVLLVMCWKREGDSTRDAAASPPINTPPQSAHSTEEPATKGQRKANPDVARLDVEEELRADIASPAPSTDPSLDAVPAGERDSFSAALRTARLAAWPLDEKQAAMPGNEGISHFAGNTVQEMTARFLKDGGVVFSSGIPGKKWQAALRMEAPYSPAPSAWIADGTRMTGVRGTAVTEWYENREEGFEHGFTLKERAEGISGETRAVVKMKLDGLHAETDPANARDLIFIDPATEQPVLSYRDLKVWDATGKNLTAEMKPTDGGFTLAVNDVGAQYPLTIDPLVASLEQKVNAGSISGSTYDLAVSGETILASFRNYVPVPGFGDDLRGFALVFVKKQNAWLPQARMMSDFDILDWVQQSGQVWNADWDLTTFGQAVAIEGNRMVITEPKDYDVGSAYIYERQGDEWILVSRLFADLEGDLGRSVALRGDRLILGSPETNYAAVFDRVNSTWTQSVILRPTPAQQALDFGRSVAIDGNRAFVGAPLSDPSTAGATFVFEKSGNVWEDGVKIVPAGLVSGDHFGTALGFSGGTLAVGAPGRNFSSVSQDIGAIYMFSSAAGWPQTHYLTRDNKTANDQLGSRLYIENDLILSKAANKVVTFTRGAGGTWGGGVDIPNITTGSFAYANNRLVTRSSPVTSYIRSGTAWNLEASASEGDGKGDANWGLSLDIDGNAAVVGALNAYGAANVVTGAAYILRRTGSTWVNEAKLSDVTGAMTDRFGVAVGISGDTVVVGADADDTAPATNNGSLSIFIKSGSVWSQQGPKLVPETANNSATGRSVAIEGNTVVAGAVRGNTNTGRVWSYGRSGTTWTSQGSVTAPTPEADAVFGFSVALSGNRMLVGEPLRNRVVSGSPITDSGTAYAYKRTAPGAAWVFEKQLNPSSFPQVGGRFGFSVAVDGNRAIIGAPGNPPNWAGGANNTTNRGSAFWSTHNGTEWATFAGMPWAPEIDNGYFGFAVEVKADVALVSAIGLDGGKGKVFLYRWEGTSWVYQGEVPAGTQAADDFFGTAVAMSGDTVLVGGYGIDAFGETNAGGGMVFRVADADAKGPRLSISIAGGNAVLSWTPAPGWSLYRNPTLSGTWTPVTIATDGTYTYPVSSAQKMFFRMQK